MSVEKIGTGGLGVNTSELKQFIRDLRLTYPKAAKGLRENLRASGEIVAVEARKLAGEHSKSIPPSIRASVYGANVSVKAGNASTPLAVLYEVGNKGKNRRPGTFSHPVFGHRNAKWADQARYPFLKPAADKTMPLMEAEVMKTVDDVVDILTLRRGL